MVGGSELAYRLLARRHGAQLAYTPMMHADKFVASADYRAAELQTMPEDQPLVAHFASNDAATLLAAARLAEPHCVAVDLNLGCPQRAAHSGRFGAFCRPDKATSDAMDTRLVLEMVSALSKHLRVPVFCKVRLFDDWDQTLAFCKQLEAAGCALLAVHARYRGSPMHRRDGPAHLDQVAEIKRALTIPVLTNGNVSSASDLLASLEQTGADGVMSAEGALDDPGIFGRAVALARRQRAELKAAVREAKRLRAEASAGRPLAVAEQATVDGLKAAKRKRRQLTVFDVPGAAAAAPVPSDLDLADEYLALAAQHRPTLRRDPLRRFELREALEALSLGAAVSERARDAPITDAALLAAGALVRKLRDYAEGRRTFVPQPAAAAPPAAAAKAAAAVAAAAAVGGAAARARAKAAQGGLAGEAQAAAAAAACAAKRANFEQIQRKKAKRQGLPEDHFLKQGRAPPTVADVAKARAMAETERMAFWRAKYGQHCIMHHINGSCEVSRAWGCGFLHEEAVGG